MRRLFFGVVGLGAGVAVGVWAVRKVEAAQRRLAPDALARSAAGHAGSLRDRLSSAVAEGRAAANAKEVELRTRFGPRADGGT
jgi:hypothetical protein